MTDHWDEVRRRLAAVYLVESELGRGGMAVVYRASIFGQPSEPAEVGDLRRG